MKKEMIDAIRQWETEYPTLKDVKLTDKQKRILNKGPEHDEGMINVVYYSVDNSYYVVTI